MQLESKSLLICADANTHIGTGHLMRCLALAQAWKDSGGEVTFITTCESDGLLERLSDEGFQIVTLERSYPDSAYWKATSQVLAGHPDAWVVLDGYHFDPAYQIRIKEVGHPLLVIDDMAHLEHYYADIVLNQNLHAEQLHYCCEPYTQFLLGTQYVLLRREFLKWRNWHREIPEVARKALVTLGGGDPDNVTLKVIRALNKLKIQDLEVRVVVGPSNPHMASLKEAVHHSPTIALLPAVENMPELMAWADLAVSAAGSTCWELTFMGVPSVLLIVADNQRWVADRLAVEGAVISLGLATMLTVEELAQQVTRLCTAYHLRRSMQTRAQRLVDGEGVVRVIDALQGSRSSRSTSSESA